MPCSELCQSQLGGVSPTPGHVAHCSTNLHHQWDGRNEMLLLFIAVEFSFNFVGVYHYWDLSSPCGSVHQLSPALCVHGDVM